MLVSIHMYNIFVFTICFSHILQSLFTATFMCSLREFVFLYKHHWQRYWNLGMFYLSRRDDDLEARLIPATSSTLNGSKFLCFVLHINSAATI